MDDLLEVGLPWLLRLTSNDPHVCAWTCPVLNFCRVVDEGQLLEVLADKQQVL